jgi:predicted nucleic acid-binding protein
LYEDILSRYRVVTNVLALDEAIYVSEKKYRVPSSNTLDFIKTEVLPYIDIARVGREEYEIAEEAIRKYGLKPSDALHVGTMQNANITTIASEDADFDGVYNIDRIWV